MNLPKFYNDEKQLETIHQNLKQALCPYCKSAQNLIFHGYLYGYSETGNQKIIRGRRIFCSNRNKRLGCGRTINIFIKTVFKKFILSTQNLWNYLINILNGLNKFQSFKQLNLPFSNTTIYRIYKRFWLRQYFIREQLCKIHPLPQNMKTSSPLIQTIKHIQITFPKSTNPLGKFQQQFQTSIL